MTNRAPAFKPSALHDRPTIVTRRPKPDELQALTLEGYAEAMRPEMPEREVLSLFAKLRREFHRVVGPKTLAAQSA